MKYCIGEFASILGVTSDTLRLYEKHGIVRPKKNSKNNYRYFHDLDARNMLMSRWYRSIQIPLHDVATLINESSSSYISEKIEDAQQKLEDNIRQSTALLERMNEINQEIKQVKTMLNQCSIKQFPGMYRLKQTRNDELLQSRKLKAVVNGWMERLPFAFYSFRIEREEALSNRTSALDYSWGITLYEDDFKQSNLKMTEYVEYMEPVTCISTVILTSEQYPLEDSLQVLFQYAEYNQLELNGDIRGRLILTEKLNSNSQSYMEVSIPVKMSKQAASLCS